MVCPYCEQKLAVTNSRLQKKANAVWRRRYCLHCHATFTSVEALDLTKSLRFMRSETRFEPFSRDRLFASVYESCKHRKDAVGAATGLTDTITSKLVPTITNGVVTRGDVCTVTQQALARFDKAALAQYIAYHPL